MEYHDVRQWLERNVSLMPDLELDAKELDHVAMCMHHIYRWYQEDYPIGDFLKAVVKNDLCEAFFRADDANRKSLYLYALFLHNKLPADYRKKALAK